MALFGLGKKKDGDNAGDGSGKDGGSHAAGGGDRFKRDPRKAARFFEHAETVADAKNFDYAIELYINGLRHDPGNMAKHEALLEVAQRRKVAGGKPGRAKKIGSETIDRMLHAEKVWAMNFTDPYLAYDVMRYAAEANAQEGNEDYSLGEIVFWIGQMAMDFNASQNSGNKAKKLYLEIRDRFADIGRFDKAVECHRRAIALAPEDSNLVAQLKDLEAQKYTMDRKESGGAMANVKDAEQQELIQAQLDTSGTQSERLIAARRAEYDENPEDLDKLHKLVEALTKTAEEANENEAIELLTAAFESTGQYRYKVRASDIKMKQLARAVRNYKQFVSAAPDDAEYREKYDHAVQQRLDFELGEYQDRVKNYPTDLRLKYEYGKRLHQAGLHDEAIGMLQQATAEPKSRSAANLLLAKSFMAKDWLDEAIQTLEKGFAEHEVKDDLLGKELRYDLLLAHKERGKRKAAGGADDLREAQQHASALLQADINYKDIRKQLEEIRELLKQAEGE